MIRMTPFHPRLAEFNRTHLWTHWSGYLSAQKYDMSVKYEYFGVRNAAAFFDSSPMFKYVIRGRDAARFLGGVMTRDVRTCRVGRAQYQIWCDDRGFVVEDGVLFRHSGDEFVLTAAAPNQSYLESLRGGLDVEIIDVSEDHAFLALQGPRSRDILALLTPEVVELPYFGLTPAKVAGTPVTISRTGYSGDLGYEVMIPSEAALPVLDAILEAGRGHGLRPFGNDALMLVRIEAGLPLIGVEFSSSRLAYNDHQRVTPIELGLGWMLKGIDDATRPFTGRRALMAELQGNTSRWRTVGLEVDWRSYADLYTGAGLVPVMDEVAAPWETMLYAEDGSKAGYATSLAYSPMRQNYVAIARVRPHLASLGTRIEVEQTVNHEYTSVGSTVVPLPFFNPPRKTA